MTTNFTFRVKSCSNLTKSVTCDTSNQNIYLAARFSKIVDLFLQIKNFIQEAVVCIQQSYIRPYYTACNTQPLSRNTDRIAALYILLPLINLKWKKIYITSNDTTYTTFKKVVLFRTNTDFMRLG